MTYDDIHTIESQAMNDEKSTKELLSELCKKIEKLAKGLDALKNNLEATGVLANNKSKLIRHNNLIAALLQGLNEPPTKRWSIKDVRKKRNT